MSKTKLVILRQFDDYIDYSIICEGTQVGTLDIRETLDYIFIRHIKIDEVFRRKGYAKAAVDILLQNAKPIRLAISDHSKNAKLFWNQYFKNKLVTRDRCLYSIETEENRKEKSYVS